MIPERTRNLFHRFINPVRRRRKRLSHQTATETLEQRALLTTFTVNSLNDSGAGSLREAVEMANATPEADEINFNLANGSTIELTSNHLNITGSLTINGLGSEELTIAGNGNFGLLSIQESTEAVNVTINGVTLTGGSGGSGGAIYNFSGTVRINDSVLTGNTASRGGAIFTIQNPFLDDLGGSVFTFRMCFSKTTRL